MKLYLVRHGIATQQLGGAIRTDAQRPLTDEGRCETEKVAQGLRRLGIKADVIMTSPLVRARQTAEILADVLGSAELIHTCQPMAPGGSASDLFKQISQHPRAENVFLVGHEPDMTRLVATLLWAGPELTVAFKKAAVCRIDVSQMPPSAPGELKWLITPKIAMAIR